MMVASSIATVQSMVPTHFEHMWTCANILTTSSRTDAPGSVTLGRGSPLAAATASPVGEDADLEGAGSESASEPCAKFPRIEVDGLSVSA